MRQLPSAKVCFLGGCPRSGRNQDPVGALARSRRPPRRRALDCLHTRCLRVKAAEKGLRRQHRWCGIFWVAEVETTLASRLSSRLADLEGRGDRYVNTLIRVAPYCREYRRKKGTSSANGQDVKLPHTRVKVSRGVPAGKNRSSAKSKGEAKPDLSKAYYIDRAIGQAAFILERLDKKWPDCKELTGFTAE